MSIDVLPSTGDGINGETDTVLSILKGARKRYKKNGSNGEYIDGKNVCAIGALGAELGLEDHGQLGYLDGFLASVETDLRSSAKTAIKLVEAAAHKLYPQTKQESQWDYAIENLNETHDIVAPEVDESGDDPDWDWDAAWEAHWEQYNKKAVLACYDYAIAKRTAALHAAL